jgi:[ribosomal protein S18]-alanine N-acetyltransferase
MYPKPSLCLRYMTTADLAQVMQIDQLSFDIPWAENSYRYEIDESNHSYMVVLEYVQEKPVTRWQRWLGLSQSVEEYIIGYGGMWNVIGEAHISTIAVHPRARGQGWGEILLAGMVQHSIRLGVEEVVLEVRVSNQRAQNLYRKYEFESVNVKARYYRNNNEDAYDMRLHIGDAAIQARFQQRYSALFTQHALTDQFSGNLPVSRGHRTF